MAQPLEKKTTYRIKRYWFYVLASVVSVGFPFVSIDGHQLFLLSFDHQQLHLAGIVFDVQELYMLPFLLMLLFVGIFAATSVGGRAWCGWACPQTIFRVIYRDLIEGKLLGLRKIKNKQKNPDLRKVINLAKKMIAISIWSGLSILAAADFMWYFVPPAEFFEYIVNPSEHMIMIGFVLGIAIFLVYDVIWLQEDFCAYICPYSRVQSVLYDDDTIQAIYHENRGGSIYNSEKDKIVFKQKDLEQSNECTTCQNCVTVCPTHIDIRKGSQLECINCLECVDACTSVMGKLGKESLVQWSSTNAAKNDIKSKFLRKKTIMYFVVLGVIIAIMFTMGAKKESLLVNVNTTSQLYKIKANDEVENNFLLSFHNIQDKGYTFDVKIIGKYAKNIKIKRFKKIFLKPNELDREILKLSTKQRLVKNSADDTSFLVTIKAYAVEKPNEIFTQKVVVFTYPTTKKLQKLKGN